VDFSVSQGNQGDRRVKDVGGEHGKMIEAGIRFDIYIFRLVEGSVATDFNIRRWHDLAHGLCSAQYSFDSP
jgi:hypothetical protein